MANHEQRPFVMTVKTRPEFLKKWRELDVEIQAEQVTRKNAGDLTLKLGASRRETLRRQEIWSLVYDELEFHLKGAGYKIANLNAVDTMLYGTLLKFELLLPVESYLE